MLCYSEDDRCYVTWIDNYAKGLARKVVRMSNEDFMKHLWTVEGRLLAVSEELKVPYVDRLADGSVRACMPDVLFDTKAVEDVLKHIPTRPELPGDINFVNIWNVNTIPPRLPLQSLSRKQTDQVQRSRNFMQRFLPIEVHDTNINSNEGLCTILKKTQDDLGTDSSTMRYHVQMADVNIFERTLKVFEEMRHVIE
jgi:hypothetical protein